MAAWRGAISSLINYDMRGDGGASAKVDCDHWPHMWAMFDDIGWKFNKANQHTFQAETTCSDIGFW